MMKVLWIVLGLMTIINVWLIIRLSLLKNVKAVSDTQLPIVGQTGVIKMIYRDDRLLVEMQSPSGSFDVVCEIQSFTNGFPRAGGAVKVSAVSGRIVEVNQVINDETSIIKSVA